jgi:Xaa-Pro dipeptidase
MLARMLTRRKVLAALALGAGAVACGGGKQALRGTASGRTRVRTTPETDFEVRSEYPPIAPLGDGVYQARRERARQIAEDANADVLLATSGATSFAYLVGAGFGRSERLIALLLPVHGGAPVVIAPAFEVERVRRGARGLKVRGWEEDEDPIARVCEWLGEARRRVTVSIEPRTEFGVVAALGRALPEATLADGAAVFEELRIAKGDEELDRMRRAVAITEDAFAATFARLEVGMREKDVARLVREEHARRGVEGGALVQFGANAALPHGGPTSFALAEGMGILIDGGCAVDGWQSDITRTRWVGAAPPERFRAIYNLVHDAQTEAIACVRPGVPAEEIDRAARKVIAAGGFGPRFTHRLGHGIGMDEHEATYIVEGNHRRLAPGFVFSVEPGIYLPGELGVRLEDDVACAPTGAAILSRRAPRL